MIRILRHAVDAENLAAVGVVAGTRNNSYRRSRCSTVLRSRIAAHQTVSAEVQVAAPFEQ